MKIFRTGAVATGTFALVAITGVMASAFTFKEYNAAPAEKLLSPALPDSTQKENAFKTEDLLNARSIIPDPAAGWTTMLPDSAGVLHLVTPETASQLNTFTTRLRADRYTEGKISLKSTARASVKVNGDVKITKNTADSTAISADSPLTLLPEADYDIVIDLLSTSADPSAPEFSLEFIPDAKFEDAIISASPSQPKRVGPLSVMVGRRVSGVSLSDDGKYLITKYRETLSASETNTYASLMETASGKIISESIDPEAAWIPGRNAYYTTKKRDGKFDFYRTDIPSMSTSLLAKGIPDKDVTISPDGRYLFYYKNVEGKAESGPMHRVKEPDDRIPGDRDRQYIMRYDVKTHIATPITYGGPSTYIYSFSPDGAKMLYCAGNRTPDKYPFYNFTLVEMDLNTLALDTIVDKMEATINNATYSPDGKQLFVIAGPEAFGGIGANYAPHEIGNDFDSQGYILDIASRKATAMTRDFDPALGGYALWNRIDNNIYFLGETGYNKYVYRLNPKSGKIDKLNSELETIRNFSIGDEEATWMAYLGGGFNNDGTAWLLNLKSGKSRIIDDPMSEWLADTEFGKMEQWQFTASDGSLIDGYMCLPPEFDPTKKYPMIVYYYGGTSPTNATFYHLYSPQVFASRGYVVYTLNPSGTTGYGQEFSARHVNAWGKRTAEEIIEGTKKFCEAHPYVDSKKIGCIGASYGGFMTQYLQTLTDIFAAAVSHAGISNVTSYWGEGYWGYSYNSVAAAKSYPWSNPDLFTKQGSLFNADKIHTPLLLLHGTVDTNVPIGESIQLFNALKILGREVEFITVQDENHIITGYDNKLAWHNTIMAWFAKWLKDDPRWWDSLYGK